MRDSITEIQGLGAETFLPGGLLYPEVSGTSYACRQPGGRVRILAKGQRAAKRIAAKAGRAATVKLVDRRKMDAAPSIEHLLAYLGDGEILHDPSGVATRARATLRLVEELSAKLGDDLSLALFDGERRRIICVLDRPACPDTASINEALRRAQIVLAGIDPAMLGQDDFAPSVAFTFSSPRGRFVPIDRRSARRLMRRRMVQKLKSIVALSATAGTAVTHVAASAQQVSGQIGGFGGVSQGDGAGAGEASIAIQNSVFGVQVDGVTGRIDGETFAEAGGHIYHRDPETGLIGVTGRWNDLGGPERWQVGVEAEYYLNRFSLVGEAGYEDSSGRSADIYGLAGVGYYPSDFSSFYVVGGYTLGEAVVQGSFEIQPAARAIPGLSVFADGGLGVSGNGFAAVGLRFAFGGGNASLIKRDREGMIRRKINPMALDSSS